MTSVMPISDFYCNACDHRNTKLVTLSKGEQVRCDKCGFNKLRRVYERKCLFGSVASSGRKNSVAP